MSTTENTDENNNLGWTPMDWGTPKGVAIFFFSLSTILVGLGVFLWGLGQLL
ncbi:MAG: hypothetical protein FWF98_02285 [Dehalococcoidia bacterium]|nr:hypothetical protein [Dehalococcoidia bacterium]